MEKLAKIGAVCFVLWGVLHLAGGSMILLSLSESPEKGFAYYQHSEGPFPGLAGSVLGYLSYSVLWLGALVTFIGVRYNWQNHERGLALNTLLVLLTEIGLVIFLILPGYVPWAEASPGLLLLVAGGACGGIACQAKSSAALSPSYSQPERN